MTNHIKKPKETCVKVGILVSCRSDRAGGTNVIKVLLLYTTIINIYGWFRNLAPRSGLVLALDWY